MSYALLVKKFPRYVLTGFFIPQDMSWLKTNVKDKIRGKYLGYKNPYDLWTLESIKLTRKAVNFAFLSLAN